MKESLRFNSVKQNFKETAEEQVIAPNSLFLKGHFSVPFSSMYPLGECKKYMLQNCSENPSLP